MQLRQPPISSASTLARNQASHAVVIAVCVLAACALAALVWVRTTPRQQEASLDAGDTDRVRQVASKLRAAGALDEAAALYERYVQATALPLDQLATLAYGLGTLYIEAGQYEKALRWLYEAESLHQQATAGAAGGQAAEVGKKIVHVLERMGRSHAAKAALAEHVGLGGEPAKHADSDPVVARIGNDTIRQSDVLRALDDLPPELAKGFAGAQQRTAFLRKYVADELILRKASKLQYDQDPEVRRRLDSIRKQLLVNAFIEREVVGKVAVDDTDLQSYFVANRSRYDQPEQAKLQIIKLATRGKATDLLEKIRRGATAFEAAAKQHSLDRTTRAKGGTLDRWIGRGESFLGEGNADAVAEAIFATAKGSVSEPVSAGDHVYLFKVQTLKPAKEAKLDEVRKRVEADYRMMKIQASYAQLVEQELASADVELFADAMAPVSK